MPNRSPRRNSAVSFYPWAFFIVLLAANTLLAYFSLPMQAKLWIGLLGIALPVVLALRWKWPVAAKPPLFSEEFLPNLPAWAWWLVFALAILERLAQWTTLSSWPLVDEGIAGFFATELSEHWKWEFFYADSQAPPLFNWGLGLFFKLCGPSLSSLWLFPALLSVLSLPLVYVVSRTFFSRSLTFVLTCLWAFSYEPLFVGRICEGHSLEVLFQLGVLGLLGALLRPSPLGPRKTQAAWLGFLTGVGFFTLHHWPMMAVFVFLAMAGLAFRDFQRRKAEFLLFLVFLSLAFLPYLWLFLSNEHGVFLKNAFAFHGGFAGWDQVRIIGQYLGSLFWGVDTIRYAFKPVWGGFLNPLAGALFFTGVVLLFRPRPNPWRAWILLGLLLFSLPALMSRDLEMLRTLLMFPLLYLVCGIGLGGLLCFSKNPRWRFRTLVIFVLSSASLDFYHLWGPYQRLWHSTSQAVVLDAKSMERYRAYQILGSMRRAQGPGLVLTGLETSPFDQTLTIAAYPFNSARNPSLSPEDARWLALLANINDAPFLSKRFPEGHWFPLAPETASPQGVLVLGVIPITPANRAALQGWLEADRALRPVTSMVFRLPFGRPPLEILDKLCSLEPSFRKDPFLESVLAEKIFLSAISCSRPQVAMDALQRGLTQGYPSANLFSDLGALWWMMGDLKKARQAFGAALRSPVNHTSAAENLRRLGGPALP